MAIKDALLPEFDHEMATTRRLLERLPEAEFAWKPHEKSMALGQLAGHIANTVVVLLAFRESFFDAWFLSLHLLSSSF